MSETSPPESEQSRQRPFCPYCADRPGKSKDHIIPRCLFPEVVPNGTYLPTVKACSACNNVTKSADDAYLRDYLALKDPIRGAEAQRKFWAGPLGRSIKRNQSQFVKGLKNPVPTSLYSPGGIYLGEAVQLEIDRVRIERALSMITRGVYFKLSKSILPAQTYFEIREIQYGSVRRLLEHLGKPTFGPPKLLDVFQCIGWLNPPATAESLWVMSFYERTCISVKTSLPGAPRRINQKSEPN